MGATQLLAEFVSGTTYDRLPPEVLHECRRCTLNYLGVALGASRHEAARILAASASEMGGHLQATILGSRGKTSVLQAATINGAMSHVLDYDDTDMETIIHPTGPVLSAALPLAEWRGLGGRELMAALAAGMEVELRVGSAVYPAHYDVGWHITGTAGTFGAAAAAGWMLGLDVGRLTHALGLAGTQASGLREMFGSMAKSLHVGKAASDGLRSALLAEKGFTASTRVLEAKRGFCAVLSSRHDLSRATEGLGSEYRLLRNGLKPYACGVVTHPTIDGVRRLSRKYGLRASDIEAIDVQVHPLVVELTGKEKPRTGLEGKFSIYFCAAIALIEGNARQSQFSDEKVNRPDVAALMERVRPVVAPDLRESQAVVSIRTVGGRVLEERVEAATGTPECPLSDDELVEKFMDLVEPILPAEKASRLVELVWALERLGSVGELIEAATP